MARHDCELPSLEREWIENKETGEIEWRAPDDHDVGTVINCDECGEAWIVKRDEWGKNWRRLRWYHRTPREKLELELET